MGDGGAARHDLALPPGVRWAVGGLSAAVVVLFALFLARQWQVDFEVYRTGGQHVLGTGLYAAQVKGADRTLLFTYTPLAALAFWPFSFVSTWAGQVVWDLLNIAALAALVAVSAAAARGRPVQRSDWQLALVALAPLSLLVWPVRYGFELGQINVVLVLAIVADLTMDVSWRGKRLPRGVLVGLAAAVKLTPLVFVPYLLVTRQWVAARNAVLTFCAATAAMFALAPAASWTYFTRYALDLRRIGDSSTTDNQTLRAALARTGLPLPHRAVDVVLAIVLCAGLALAAVAYRRSSVLLGMLVCAATGLLLSPISWQHHYVWCVPLLVWLALGSDGPRRRLPWVAVTALVFVVTPPGHSADAGAAGYVRENAYVLATVGFLGAAGVLLRVRSRVRAPADAMPWLTSHRRAHGQAEHLAQLPEPRGVALRRQLRAHQHAHRPGPVS